MSTISTRGPRFLPSIDPSFCQTSLIMSKEWSNSWNSKNWNWYDQQWNQGQEAWTQPETWQSQEVPPPKIRTPPEWKSTSTMYDDELLYGHKFHKTIQPTAWSRRKNICGLNPLTVPIGLLTRHGASEFGLRLLSEGRFLGIITTRSIAESVFGAQLLKAMRDQGVDIDTLSEHLHRTADPDAPIPSKSEDPTGFMSPLVHAVVSKLKEISPTKQDTQALRELQHVQKKLKETEEKLRQSQKAQRTPSLPEVETPSSRPAVGSQDPDEDPIEPFEEHPPVAASKKRRASAAALGASPKAKTQRGLEVWVRRSDQVPQPKASLTAEEVMNPSKPVIRDQQPKSGSQGDIKKWMEQFDVETQQTAKKILEMLADHKYSKAKPQNAAAQYGLNVQDPLKYQPKSLQQVIAYAAAMSSWLALAHHLFAPHEVHSDIKILRAFLIQIIHHVPAIQKNMAMWSFGLLHLVSLFGYPSGTSVTTIWQRRLSSLGISLETYTFAFFNHACSVYIKLPFYWTFQKFSDKIAYHQHGRFYIGSTSISAAKRDFNRMAKLKQTLSDSAVHVELAIRYWASNPSDFEQFSTIVLRTTTLYQDAWIYEHLLISKWQAPLNFPFITEILKLKAKGWQLQYRRHNQQFPRVPLGDRLYRRVRRKLHSLHCFISESSFLFYTDWRHQDALPTTQLPVSDLASFMTGNSTPFIDWQPIWKNHLDLRLATRWNKRSNFVIWPNHLWILLWAYLSWHIPLSIRILQGGCEIMYFDTKRWLFHYTYLQPSYVKLPFPRFGTFFTTIEEQKHGGILTMLITFLAVVIGFANTVHNCFPPLTLVPLKTFRSLHISEFFSQPMRILRTFTADNHFLNYLHSESLHGLNNMDFRPLQMRRFVPFSMHNGHSIPKSWQLLHDLHFTASNIFNNGFPQKRFYTMGIMNKPNWQCFAHTCIFRVLGTHGMIQNCFVDYLWPMMKLKEPLNDPFPIRSRRNTNGPSIQSLPCHMVSFSWKGRNNSRKAVHWFPTFEADMGDFFRLQPAPLTPCCYNFGPKLWDNWPYLRFGKLFIIFCPIHRWIYTYTQSMMI